MASNSPTITNLVHTSLFTYPRSSAPSCHGSPNAAGNDPDHTLINDLEQQPVATAVVSPSENANSTNNNDSANASGQVKRELKQRHIAMMALGGTIGTGLFVGTQRSLSEAGPVGALIGYTFMATIVYSIAQSVGEMTTFIPITGSFAVFVSRFLSPAIGAAVGWLYWFSWSTTFGIELSVIAQTIVSWYDGISIFVWISIFLVLLTATNFFPVRLYGEIEFVSAIIKVVALVVWIIYAVVMVLGGGPKGFIGFKYWHDPGVFGPGILVSSPTFAKFLGILSALVNAAFTYQGVELVGVSAGEASNPRKAIPRAINRTFFRILVFYLGSIILLGLLIPYNHDSITLKENASPLNSPFVVAIVNSGTPILPHIFKGVILITIISAGNSNVYVGSRLLYALGTAKIAPRFLTKTNRYGVPIYGVLCTSAMGLVAFLAVTKGAVLLSWLLNIGAVAGLICWICIAISHLQFIKALKLHGLSRDRHLLFKSWGGRGYVWYSLVCLIVVTVLQGFPAYFDWSVYRFLTTHISLIIFVALWGFFQLFLKSPIFVKLADVDIVTGSKLQELQELAAREGKSATEIDVGDYLRNEGVEDEKKPTTFWGKFKDTIF
jgi:amino acid transporter